MKTLNVSWIKTILLASTLSILSSCDNGTETMGNGEAEFQITDAPSDDASIKGVFVTVADVKVDGMSLSGFTKQTIDLKAYQQGNTKVLGTSQLNAKAYSQITLVLDTDADAAGNAPGCYVLTTDNAKYKLASGGTINVTVVKSWSVVANAKSTVVMDFDLRKSIRAMSDEAVRYSFVSNDNLQTSVRLVVKEKAGMISGAYTEQTSSNADKIVVYAYKKGTYTASTETQAQGEDAIYFKNAVASAEVSDGLSKTFKVAFLEEGDYELHFAAYTKDLSNRFVLSSMLNAQTSVNGTVGDFVAVQGGATLSISSTVTGIL